MDGRLSVPTGRTAQRPTARHCVASWRRRPLWPGADEVQLDLLGNYHTNVELYPSFQEYFRTHTPPLLAAWGATTRSSYRRAPRPSHATTPTPRSSSSTPVTSR